MSCKTACKELSDDNTVRFCANIQNRSCCLACNVEKFTYILRVYGMSIIAYYIILCYVILYSKLFYY